MKSCLFHLASSLCLVFMASTGTMGCDPVTGPAGLTQCFLDRLHYSKYQYGTCVTDAYIRQRSGGHYGCRDITVTYCYYPCMIEKFGIDQGPVYEDCLCDISVQLQQQSVILPASCYSPAGMHCDFYRQCLAEMFNCTGPAEYAISYGEKFCNLYEQSKSQLSQEGVRWLDAARKCLQVALVPALYLSQMQPSCQDIRIKAFDSHVPCYVEPYEGISVCSLSVSDWIIIIMTVKSSFVSSAWLETVKASLLTAAMCVGLIWS